ncbi:MAG: helix-turn-helix transcriptional regulator [Lachnospiraceae bacterium]|nr:helix-turn-helix transcriptional regulator [Candidatus Colinaster equi]
MLEKKALRALSRNLKAEPDNYMNCFRRNISMYIEQKEITLQEVAELADISLSTLKSFLYSDTKDCNLSMAVKLARVFKVSVDELVGCGTLSPQTCESLQTVRLLPESFTHFVRWSIHYHYSLLTSKKVTDKAIEVMNAVVGECGNLKMTNRMSVIDISELNDDIRPKVFMGIRIPSDMYAPEYFEGNILLLANDRVAMPSERVVVSGGGSMWILDCRDEKDADGKKIRNYYSIRDGKKRADEHTIESILGYIVKVQSE